MDFVIAFSSSEPKYISGGILSSRECKSHLQEGCKLEAADNT
jgi:hypothetical protein